MDQQQRQSCYQTSLVFNVIGLMSAHTQNCYFHKNHPLTKFCTAKQCTLPLCDKCQAIHLKEHQKNKTQPLILFLSKAYEEATTHLTKEVRNIKNKRSQYQQNSKIVKQKVLSAVNQIFLREQQRISVAHDSCNKMQDKLSKIEKGSLKSLIYYYSQKQQFVSSGNCLSKWSQGAILRQLIQNIARIQNKNGESSNRREYISLVGSSKAQQYRNQSQNKASQPEFIRNTRHIDQTSLKRQERVQDPSHSQLNSRNNISKINIETVVSNRHLVHKNNPAHSDNYSALNLYNQSVKNLQNKQKKYYVQLKRAIQRAIQSKGQVECLEQCSNQKPENKYQMNVTSQHRQMRSRSCADELQNRVSSIVRPTIQNKSLSFLRNTANHDTKDYKSVSRTQQQERSLSVDLAKTENTQQQYEPRKGKRNENMSDLCINQRLTQIRNRHKSPICSSIKSLNYQQSVAGMQYSKQSEAKMQASQAQSAHIFQGTDLLRASAHTEKVLCESENRKYRNTSLASYQADNKLVVTANNLKISKDKQQCQQKIKFHQKEYCKQKSININGDDKRRFESQNKRFKYDLQTPKQTNEEGKESTNRKTSKIDKENSSPVKKECNAYLTVNSFNRAIKKNVICLQSKIPQQEEKVLRQYKCTTENNKIGTFQESVQGKTSPIAQNNRSKTVNRDEIVNCNKFSTQYQTKHSIIDQFYSPTRRLEC